MSPIPQFIFNDPFVSNLRLEARKLRQDVARLERSVNSKEKVVDKLNEEIANLKKDQNKKDKKNKELENEVVQLKDELNLLKGINEKNAENATTFKLMIFGRKDKPKEKSNRKRGGQLGHKGVTRNAPEIFDEEKDIFLNLCPDCGLPLTHSGHFKPHIVEDIPELVTIKIKTVKYNINEQYCPNCKTHKRAIPEGVIPGSRLGFNLTLFIIILRTISNQSLYQTSEILNILFGTDISPGGIVKILHNARKQLGPTYDEILRAIQQAKVKHADETSWSTDGASGWDWVFLTANEVYHTIRNTRGKGVPQEIIGGKNCRKDSVLTTDSYAGYDSIECEHQRCWSHLLRIIRDKLKIYPDSEELKTLNNTLGNLFGELSDVVSRPFEIHEREQAYQYAWPILEGIISSTYSCPHTKKIQTRIRNDNKELLTAILHEGVPLTNNVAERAIRPMVIFRKNTGGSKSDDGAKTTAVIRSVVQTIKVRKQPLVETLKEELLKGMRQNIVLKRAAV